MPSPQNQHPPPSTPPLVVLTASTVRQSSYITYLQRTVEAKKQKNKKNPPAYYNHWAYFESVSVGETEPITTITVCFCLLGVVLHKKMKLLFASQFNGLCLFSRSASILLPLDRQVWECEQNALEGDRQWPQTVSILAWSTGACSGCSYLQTAKTEAPSRPSSAI